jgi:Flp pilus assembly protein TadG
MNRTAHVAQDGSAATEIVLLTPVLIVVLLFVVALGRIGSSREEVQAAARDAARDGANARSVAAAIGSSELAARATLHEGGVACQTLSITLDTAEFHAGGRVTAIVSCTVALRDLVGFGIPASRTISARFTQPIDEYRALS